MPVLSSVLPDRYSFKATARCLDRIRFAAALPSGDAVAEVKSAVIANAQSKVLIVEFHQPAAEVDHVRFRWHHENHRILGSES